MNQYIKILYILFLSAVFFSCNRDDFYQKTEINIEPSDYLQLKKTNLTITVTDEFGNALRDVNVNYGENSVTTDENGQFYFTGVLLNDNGELFTFSKDGYFNQYNKIYPRLNETLEINVSLYKQDNPNTISSNSSFKSDFYDNMFAIYSKAGNFLDQNTVVYNGDVKLFLKSNALNPYFINSTPNNGDNTIIISSQVNSSTIEIFPLISFYTTFQKPSGEPLLIKDSLSLSIDEGLVNLNIGNLTLLYYDENAGNWISKGAIINNGSGSLDFKIKKAGYYAIGVYDLGQATITCNFKYSNGIPVDFGYVEIKNMTYNYVLNIFTDENGKCEFEVPEGSDLKLILYNCIIADSFQLSGINGDVSKDFTLKEAPYSFQFLNIKNSQNEYIKHGVICIDKNFGTNNVFFNSDSILNQVFLTPCDETSTIYDLDNLPDVYNSYPIFYDGQDINPSDYPTIEYTPSYFYLKFEDSGEELFEGKPSVSYEDGSYFIQNNFISSIVLIKVGKTNNNSYKGDIALIQNQYFDHNPTFNLIKSENTSFQLSENSNEIFGSFTFDLVINGSKKSCTGFLRIPK